MSENDTVQTSKMLKNSRLARSISDASWSTMRQMLTYKCDWHGRTLLLIEPKDTSRRCHECGHIDARNRPTQSTFACVSCGHTNHADVNGALNILARAEGIW